jgi:hypothetical protein
LITLPHFSVSSAMNLPKSAGEPACTKVPSSVSRALNLGSASAALISLLSLSMMPGRVSFARQCLDNHSPRNPARIRSRWECRAMPPSHRSRHAQWPQFSGPDELDRR